MKTRCLENPIQNAETWTTLRRFGLLMIVGLFLTAGSASADLCGDAVTARFAMFQTIVPLTVACPAVDLSCAGPPLGLPGPCRFSIDIETDTIRIEIIELADYGSGASFTFDDLDCLVCDGTVEGVLSDVTVSYVNASGFVPTATFTDHSVTVSIASGVTRWNPGEYIELHLEFGGMCPQEPEISHRSGWVPNVGKLDPGEYPLGDLYLFRCPQGGTFDARIDTKDDLDIAESCLDPVLEVFDTAGGLVAFGDDDFDCANPLSCGFSCPLVTGVPCGNGGPFSLVVRDYGTASATGEHCDKGGGYELELEVFDASGQPVSVNQVAIGLGGSLRAVPLWARNLGFTRRSANLDDENVPSYLVLPFEIAIPAKQ